MRPQLVTTLLGFGLATSPTVTALNITQEGPFALHVQGQAKNSSINGYIYFADLGPLTLTNPLQYAPMPSPPVGNTSYEWYFNYTGLTQTHEHQVGYLLTDPMYDNNNTYAPDTGFGRAMSLFYTPDTNVAFSVTGTGSVTFLAFDNDNKAFVSLDVTDSSFVPNVKPTSGGERINLYNWAICWQYHLGIYAQALSWITYGPFHNPTCERVDLIRVAL
ncbi:hypothetical protein NPX13_g3425 [Xylaria arbuscula]|uniref:Uncharacterized protein n=1 Tax=Xylaria arbuscula TaxID=114810 RepID=A0A9W8NIR3_9PEZI|nr:hypothetical protein NPX13_g3425 [Xylaria arbuscula]